MEEIGDHVPPSSSTINSEPRHNTTSFASRLKRNCLYFAASFREALTYVKAFFVGQTKRLTARNEKEATEAELATAKMQVEATDAAEETKTRLNKSA